MKYCTELTVASLLIYPPAGTEASGQAREIVRYRIKQARAQTIEQTVERLCKAVSAGEFGTFFEQPRTLVPVPGHAPHAEGTLWVPWQICQAMVAAGLGTAIVPCVRRVRVVPRQSARTSAKARLTPAEHADTMIVEGSLTLGSRVLLVEDVVIRGATLLATASMLQAQNPNLDIAAFALVRGGEAPLSVIKEMRDPKIEVITCDDSGLAPARRPLAG